MPILSNNKYIFLTTLLFFLILWFINPSNYIIAASFFLLIFVYNFKIKNLKLSFLLALLSSSIIYTGKSYHILLVPKGILPTEIYPMGYYTSVTITANLILSFLGMLIVLRDLINKNIKKVKLKIVDIIVLLFFLWPIIVDLLGSKEPLFSLLFSIQGLSIPILYFFIKFENFNKKYIKSLFISLFSALLIFESLISFQQLVAKSPLGKNLEAQTSIEYFGRAVDELQFTFRPVGTFTHANILGMWISSYIIVYIALLIQKPSKWLALIVLIGIAILLTTISRSSWLGFTIGVLIILFILEKQNKIKISNKMNRYLTVFVTILIPFVLIFALPRFEKSIYTFSEGGGYFRKVQMEKSKTLLLRNPILGVGSNRSVQEGLSLINQRDPNPSIILDVHDWYILNTIEHGFISTFVFLLLVISYIKRLENNYLNIMEHLGWFGGVIAGLIVGVFQPFINFQILILALVFL